MKKILFFVVVILLIVIGILFVLLFVLSNQEVSFATAANPNAVVEVASYNPFTPKTIQYIKLFDEEAYLVNETRYQRSGLFSYSNPEEGGGFEVVDSKIVASSLEEVKEKWKNKNQDSVALDEYYAENGKPDECQRLLEFPNFNRKIADFSFVEKGVSFADYFDEIPDRGYTYKKDSLFKFQVRIGDGQNTEIIKIVFNYLERPSNNDQTKLDSIEIVDKDCNVATVPVEEDETFNFDSALSSINAR